MRRVDMEPGVLYAIAVGNNATRPGYVIDSGKSPDKCLVRTFWTWPGQDEGVGFLNPNPPVVDEQGETQLANTSEVIELWSEYCERRTNELAVRAAKQRADDERREAERHANLVRTGAVIAYLREHGYPEDDGVIVNLHWCATTRNPSRMTASEFSAANVIAIVEHLMQGKTT